MILIQIGVARRSPFAPSIADEGRAVLSRTAGSQGEHMAQPRTLDLLRPLEDDPDDRSEEASRTPLQTRIECLEQILRAFHDIADRDDIHQAADRLVLVREWILNEAERAAADPIFVDLRLV